MMRIRRATNGQTARNLGGVLALILGVSLLGGCQTARSPELLSNPNYSAGYGDGCQTGHSRVAGFDDTITKNRELAASEPAYEIGWRDGFHACGGQNAESESNSDREIFINHNEHYGTVPR